MTIPSARDLLPELFTFCQELSGEIAAGRVRDWADTARSIKAFFTQSRLAQMEKVLPGWKQMASYANGTTQVHVSAVLLSLLNLPEYQKAAPDQQRLMEWIALFHDIGKRVLPGGVGPAGPAGRDRTHAFRSAALAGRALPDSGFALFDPAGLKAWALLTQDAVCRDAAGDQWIQDNRRLPEIFAGIDHCFGAGSPASLILYSVLLHLSINTLKDWPQATPLSYSEIERYITSAPYAAPLLPLLQSTYLADNAAWQLFDPDLAERYRAETLAIFDLIFASLPPEIKVRRGTAPLPALGESRARARDRAPGAPQFHLRPPDLENDFAQLAALFSSFETNPSTEEGLKKWYAAGVEKQMQLTVAAAENGRIGGLNCLYRRGEPASQAWDAFLIVATELRSRGLGSRLYSDLLQTAGELDAQKIYFSVRDDDPASLRFAEQRGFQQRAHGIEMMLHLATFDDSPYDPIIADLKAQGFVFTNMAELGNTEEAQRKLYHLNSTAAASTPGNDNQEPWSSFEDFQKSVCQANWYRPDGQWVVVDSQTGAWAAMSAITCFEAADSAYNLFTGVDMPYRGRKLAQAVKVLALRYARQVLGAEKVRTQHNALNAPMLAIDRKLGYFQTPGMYGMVKNLRP